MFVCVHVYVCLCVCARVSVCYVHTRMCVKRFPLLTNKEGQHGVGFLGLPNMSIVDRKLCLCSTGPGLVPGNVSVVNV